MAERLTSRVTGYISSVVNPVVIAANANRRRLRIDLSVNQFTIADVFLDAIGNANYLATVSTGNNWVLEIDERTHGNLVTRRFVVNMTTPPQIDRIVGVTEAF